MKEKSVVAVIGGTGREHALVNQYLKDDRVERAIVIPGNPLMSHGAKKEVVIFQEYKGKRLTTTNIPEILEICRENGVDFVDVGQDNAIASGVGDATREAGIPTIGFGKKAARLESDKAYSRSFGEGIPVPDYKVFKSIRGGLRYLETATDMRRAIKAAYLAGGKGVLSAKDNKEAADKIRELRRNFPEAAKKYLLEEWMLNEDGTSGEEFSAFFIFDGTNWQFLGDAQDYKLSETGDKGENTGSMGGNSPTYIYTDEVRQQTEEIADKTFSGLKKRRIASPGILYVSGMVLIRSSGKIIVKLVEHNARWGDPEAQLIVPGIENFFELNWAAANGDLNNVRIKRDGKKRLDIAGAAKGYPRDYSGTIGKVVNGLDKIMDRDGIRVFGGGIGVDKSGNYVVSGTNGRIFHVLGEGWDIINVGEEALKAMKEASIEGDNLHFRTDIGWRDVQRLRK